MERLDVATDEWIEEEKKKLTPAKYAEEMKQLLADIEGKMRKMYLATDGLIHGDLSAMNNTLMRLGKHGEPDEIFFIDYGDEGIQNGNEHELKETINQTLKSFKRII